MSSNAWQTYKLEQVLEVKYGKDHKALSVGDIPVYGSGGIMRYAAKALYQDTSILIPRKGTLNNLFFLDKPFWTVDTMFYTILNRELIDPKFLFYKLTTFNYSEMNVGTAVPSMTVQVLNELEITIPERPIQESISFILSSIDDKIENNLATNQTLEEIARTLFKEWFVNFNYPNADGNLKHSEFGEIPESWSINGIGEICYVQNGYAFKSKDFQEQGEVGIIKIKNISGNVVDIQNTDFVDSSVVSSLDKKFKIDSGSLLIAMTGAEVGKIGLVPLTEKNLWLNQRVGMFQEKIAFGNLFMYLLLSTATYQTAIQNSALGSAQPNISASAIESIRAIIPPAELIEAFGKTIKPMFEKILDNLAENETLKTTRDSLLPKLMSGEIEVNG
ncbi:MAG: restriction endonuclease subunit S [Bacteroidota bacterium]|jgi:type I restriction enzyme S subunit